MSVGRLSVLRALVIVSVIVAPAVVEAQQAGRLYRVAYVNSTTPLSEMAGAEPHHPHTREFFRALRALGWVEGQNVILERRSAEGRFERFGDILRDLVDLKCDVIVTTGTPMAREAQRITTTVPIVVTGADPLGAGLVASLARPGGNLTGVGSAGPHLEGKKLELLKEALPKTKRVAVLTSRSAWDGALGQAQRAAAGKLGVTLLHVEFAPNDQARAFVTITKERPDAIFVAAEAFLYAHRRSIVDFATHNQLPLMGQNSDFTEEGGLLSYAPNLKDYHRVAASYVDRILKGAKPGDLPIQEPTKYDLVINARTVKALGLTIPPSVLLRADQIIE